MMSVTATPTLDGARSTSPVLWWFMAHRNGEDKNNMLTCASGLPQLRLQRRSLRLRDRALSAHNLPKLL